MEPDYIDQLRDMLDKAKDKLDAKGYADLLMEAVDEIGERQDDLDSDDIDA